MTAGSAVYIAEWIKERIPKTDYILTKDRIHEIMEDSSDSIILINENQPNSFYTSYILLDGKKNKSLEIRYNKDRFEDIYGVITPAISERIKDIINDLNLIIQEQELISSEVTDINLEPVTTLLDEKIIATTPNFFEKVDPNNKPPSRSPISDGNPLNHIRKAITIALEKEQKPIALQTSTVIPILTPPADLPQVTGLIQVEEELSVSKPVPIEEELAVSELEEIDLKLQVVKEEQIKEMTKVQQPTKKITQKKKPNLGGR